VSWELLVVGRLRFFVAWDIIWIEMFPRGAHSGPLFAPFGTCDIESAAPFGPR
jgi:hypothetical protein